MGSVDTTIKQMDVWIPTPPALGNWSFLVILAKNWQVGSKIWTPNS